MQEFIVLVLYALGVPIDILTLTLMIEQIGLALKGGISMLSKNSYRVVVCACGGARPVLLSRHDSRRAWWFKSTALRLFQAIAM